jgi:hypothetical protein
VIETRPQATAVGRRLRPVYAAAWLQNVALWVPIERAGDESAPIRQSELADQWIQRRCKWLH